MDRVRVNVERFEGAARVRVRARGGRGGKALMVGLVPRAALEEIRRRVRAAEASGAGAVRIETRPLSLQAVRVDLAATGEVVPARRLILAIAVRSGPEAAGERAGAKRPGVELVLEANRILAERPRLARIAVKSPSPPSPSEEEGATERAHVERVEA